MLMSWARQIVQNYELMAKSFSEHTWLMKSPTNKTWLYLGSIPGRNSAKSQSFLYMGGM